MGHISIKDMLSPRAIIGRNITAAFKQLLENRHLYQSIVLDVKKTETDAEKYEEGHSVGIAKVGYATAMAEWICPTANEAQNVSATRPDSKCIQFKAPKLKLYCRKCKRAEAFLPSQNHSGFFPGGLAQQVFVFGYRCQSCELADIEIFMVKRDKAKLTLCGRTPMEMVVTSKFFPKDHSKFISDAIIAHNAGQTLAGLFFLRTFIEQFVVQKTGKSQAEGALEEYQKALPNSLKPQIYSFADLYAQLSAKVHAADADEKLFDEAVQKMESHFELLKAWEKAEALR